MMMNGFQFAIGATQRCALFHGNMSRFPLDFHPLGANREVEHQRFEYDSM